MKSFKALIICTFLTSISFSQKVIIMEKQGGVYVVPCIVNGVRLKFIFDTGASDVSISSTEALFMLKNGYLESSDIIGKGKYINADGNISNGTKIILKKIEFAGLVLKNVEASIVNNLHAPLLLGQSAINKLGKIQLEGNKLIIQVNNKSLGIKSGVNEATLNDSVSYSLGVRIGQSLKTQGFDNVNMSVLQKALTDVAQNKALALDEADISETINRYQQKLNAVKEAEQRKENAAKSAVARQQGQAFLAENGKRAGVVSLPSGLQYEVLKAGTDNTRPLLTNKVKCHYTGTLINGTKFESSVDRGEPITFPLGNVIRGWQEALQLMTVGSKWKLFIPADLAYGDNPNPGGLITPGATLVFEVELLGVEN